MSVTTDPAIEQRIEREMARGIYREPADVLNRALDLLESQEDWLSQNKEAIGELLEERWAESEAGKSLSESELLEFLEKTRQKRSLRRAG
jgi:Arc/MetJ-type ribon-helix-helix transcriptional regulator